MAKKKAKRKPKLKKFLVSVEYQPYPDSLDEEIEATSAQAALAKFYQRYDLDGDVLDERVEEVKE